MSAHARMCRHGLHMRVARAHVIVNVKTNLIIIDLIIILGGADYSLSLTGHKKRTLHYYT